MNAFKMFKPFKSFKPYFGGFNDRSLRVSNSLNFEE